MSIRRRKSGGYQARVMIDGRQFSATLPSREEARDIGGEHELTVGVWLGSVGAYPWHEVGQAPER
jgi:hypothetical protein